MGASQWESCSQVVKGQGVLIIVNERCGIKRTGKACQERKCGTRKYLHDANTRFATICFKRDGCYCDSDNLDGCRNNCRNYCRNCR